MEKSIKKRLLTVEEAATYLGLAPQTIYNRTHKKSKNPFPVRPLRIGRALRFDIRQLEQFVKNLSQSG